MNLLDGFRIVLVEPQNPINVGTVIRAMKNMGLTRLRLVKPAPMDLERTQISAHHSEDMLSHVEIFDSLDDALADVHVSYGFSARKRTRTWSSLEMEDAMQRASERVAAGEIYGLVFGREQTGLTNDELMRCRYQVYIDTSEYSSLNLAQAVLLVCYSAHRLLGDRKIESLPDNHARGSRPATQEEQTRLLKRMHEALIEVGFYKAPTRSTAMHRVHNILSRAQLHDDEIRLLLGMCTEVIQYATLLDRGVRREKIRPVDDFLDGHGDGAEKHTE